MKKEIIHSERKHSKFSASGAGRWFACPGSVALSEGQPDKSSPWAKEGTQAHEILESIMRAAISQNATFVEAQPYEPKDRFKDGVDRVMYTHAARTANFILGLHKKTPGSDIMVETRIHLKSIHPEMFGTFDGSVIQHFGTLHVFDFKYGAGHFVTPAQNLQMIFYAVGLAELYDWNFKNVRMWIDQPRIKGYDGPLYWQITIAELKTYVPQFKAAVKRVEDFPNLYREGNHCHWCKAKSICPLKKEEKLKKARDIFSPLRLEDKREDHEKEKSISEKIENWKKGKTVKKENSAKEDEEWKEMFAGYRYPRET